METLSTQVWGNRDNADRASRLTDRAARVGLNGVTVLAASAKTMEEVSRSSRKVGEITECINGIAFQTYILALNAAVEPARAGEQGRGFAVVAQAVRDLAQRSSKAATEINDLIGDCVTKVAKGVDQVNAAGDAMKQVMESIRSLRGLVKDILEASSAQEMDIGHIGEAVVTMEASNRQNQELVVETGLVTGELENQARALREVVGNFHLANAATELTQSDEAPAAAWAGVGPLRGQNARGG